MNNNKFNYIGELLLGLSIAGLILFGIGVLNGWWLENTFNNAIGSIFTLGIIALALAILLIANLILTVVNIKNHALPLAHLYSWGPVLLALAALLILSAIKDAKKEFYEQSHPNIQEMHINLSGKFLWIGEASSDNALSNTPDQFVEVTRYAGGNDKMLAYNGSRLAESFKNVSIYSSETASADSRVVLTLPVVQAKSYPAVASFLSKVKEFSLSGYSPTEASLLVYQYYYYADHVEVAPAINLSGSDSMALWGSNIPVVEIHIANLQPQSIARLEVDGVTLALGSEPRKTETNSNECISRNYGSPMINILTAPLKVRWQFVEPNPQWHEAKVTVPQLPALKAKPDWKSRDTQVFLYFQKDGSVTSQWQQVVTLKGDKLGLRTTAILPKLIEPAPCGAAEDGWTEEAVRIKR